MTVPDGGKNKAPPEYGPRGSPVTEIKPSGETVTVPVGVLTTTVPVGGETKDPESPEVGGVEGVPVGVLTKTPEAPEVGGLGGRDFVIIIRIIKPKSTILTNLRDFMPLTIFAPVLTRFFIKSHNLPHHLFLVFSEDSSPVLPEESSPVFPEDSSFVLPEESPSVFPEDSSFVLPEESPPVFPEDFF